MTSRSKPSSSPRVSGEYPFFATALCGLVAFRLWIASTTLPARLRNSHILTTPLSSFTELQEGIYLFDHDVDPYAGGSFRHSPLLLALFTTILPRSERTAPILWAISDIVSAWGLAQIWSARQNVPISSTSRLGKILAAYLLNPYILLPSLALSTSSFENALVILAIAFACKGRRAASLLTLSFLLHLSLSSVVLVLPIFLILLGKPTSQLASPQAVNVQFWKLVPLAAEYLAYGSVLAVLSTLVAGNLKWIPQTWGATLTLPDLTPNTGMWWYFFTEMFDHFRPFFLMVFNAHLLIYVVPICIKFQHDPLFATYILVGILGTFKAYATLSDPGLFISMVVLFPEIYPYFRHPIVTILLHLHAAILMPLFHHLWLSQGTGNANFFYATTLVFACSNGAALVDSIWAGLRIAIGKLVEGYKVVQE